MEIAKSIILLCCAYYGFASHSHGGHIIPVENYESELHNLGEHVEIPETPVRVIKITKTVAVKVPVPYPVKVIQKVPYPVHVSKPYPVPVPHIVKVPHVESPKPLQGHEALGSHDGQQHSFNGHTGNYQVFEHNSKDGGDSYEPEAHSYSEGYSKQTQQFSPFGDDHSSEVPSGNSYEGPSHSYYGAGNNIDNLESKNYDEAIKNYFQNFASGGNAGHGHQNYN